jgi:hypothetical protein
MNKEQARYNLTMGLGRFTAATTTGAIFAMRNGTTKTLKIHRMELQVGFSGAASAATTQIIQLKRFSGATHSGGSSLLTSVVNNSTLLPASSLLDARQATISGTSPLTDTSVVYEAACRNTILPRTLSGLSSMVWFSDIHDELSLQPSEGLAVFITETAVAGDSIVGLVGWSEDISPSR